MSTAIATNDELWLADVLVEYPQTVALFGGTSRFYRCINYSLAGNGGTGEGSGGRRKYSRSQLRVLVLRKLLSDALAGSKIDHGMNPALAGARWFHEVHTATIMLGLSSIELFVPAALWDEVAPT